MKNKYQVIIIGAGISGLVCGAYLSKFGIKTLIVEQHFQAGGYCSSFKRKGFYFDVGVHCLGGLRNGGLLNQMFLDLDLYDKISISRSNPSDRVYFSGKYIDIVNNNTEIISTLQSMFFSEKNAIEKFFNFILNAPFNSLYLKLKDKTFEVFLNNFFTDRKLKRFFCTFLGNIGLSSVDISALAVVFLFREYVLDNGYYVKGGLQNFPNALAKIIKENGGDVFLSRKVTKIIVNKKEVKGIIIDGKEQIIAECIVSNCDYQETFIDLIGGGSLEIKILNKCKTIVPSFSAAIVYLGVDFKIFNKIGIKNSIWYIPSDTDIDKFFADVSKGIIDFNNGFFLLASPSAQDDNLAPHNNESIYLSVPMPFRSIEFWRENKHMIGENIIKRVSKLIPDIEKHIVVTEVATPVTLNKYTNNTKGALYGLAPTISQLNNNFIKQKTQFKGLYLTGHWTSWANGKSGIPGVAAAGKRAAKMVIEDITKIKETF